MTTYYYPDRQPVTVSGEQWRPVLGFEDRYDVSDQGQVWSRRTRRMLKPSVMNEGYLKVGLGKDNRRSVASIVCAAFNGPRPDGHQVRHLNGQRQDNRAANLAWGTPEDNAADKIAHGTNPKSLIAHCLRGHPLSGDNVKVRKDRPSDRPCKACAAEYARTRRDGGNGWRPHGFKKYNMEGCRCDVCKKAKREYRAAWMAAHPSGKVERSQV